MKNVVVISNAGDPHTDHLVRACDDLGARAFRINTERFRLHGAIDWTVTAGTGSLAIDGRSCRIEDIDLLIYRRPQRAYAQHTDRPAWLARLIDDEWQSLELALSTSIRGTVLNPVAGSAAARNKLIQVRTAIGLGMKVPEIIVSTVRDTLHCFACRRPAVTKSIETGGIIEGDKLHSCHTRAAPPEAFDGYDAAGTPTLLQQRIMPAATWRIVTIGQNTFGFRNSGPALADDIDSRKIEDELRGEPRPVPVHIHDQLQAFRSALGISFASSDFLEDDAGELWFIDLNPDGQWAFLEELHGVKLSHEIVRLAWGRP
jgi:hypothetical protein